MSKKFNRAHGFQPDKGGKEESKKVVFSYLYHDISQGQNLEKWDKTAGRLLSWNNKMKAINQLNIRDAITLSHIFIYNNLDTDNENMPKKSKWKYPKILPKKDITWCKIELGNKVRVIGYLEEHIFYIVFLDEDHEFYPTEPHNT